MLKSWTPGEEPDKDEMKVQLEKTRNRLYDLQMKIKEHKLPVLVLFEGWSAAGKGSMIGKVIFQGCHDVSSDRGRGTQTVSVSLYETDPGRRQIYIPGFRMDGTDGEGSIEWRTRRRCL